MVQDKPLVSVVIPTYKRPRWLTRAIDSVLAQTYDNCEVVVVNDNVPGSSYDLETQETLALYRGVPAVRVLHTSGENGGGAARNYACREARGQYLAFLDDDDVFLPGKIEQQLLFMLSSGLDMSWQDVAWYDENDCLVEHRKLNHCDDYSQDGLLRAHLLTPIAPTSIYMLKKDLFAATEGFGEVATGQDWWLMLRCIEARAKIGYMPGVYVRQYIHGGERLSVGSNKIKGEAQRHEYVKRYYSKLSKKDVRYIEFRHNAVLMFACLRSNDYFKALKYGARAMCASPRACFAKGFEFFTKGKRM